MGNTDAHLKNWARLYPDGRNPQLAPVYDCVCVASFFENTPTQQYAVNKAIDHSMRQLSWSDLEALIKSAGLLRVPRHMALLRELVMKAKAQWPALLTDAPTAMRQTILERLQGGVALTRD